MDVVLPTRLPVVLISMEFTLYKKNEHLKIKPDKPVLIWLLIRITEIKKLRV